jgi:hypothetical protein
MILKSVMAWPKSSWAGGCCCWCAVADDSGLVVIDDEDDDDRGLVMTDGKMVSCLVLSC